MRKKKQNSSTTKKQSQNQSTDQSTKEQADLSNSKQIIKNDWGLYTRRADQVRKENQDEANSE